MFIRITAILALTAGTAAFAMEQHPARTAAEIQAEIQKLQIELQHAITAEQNGQAKDTKIQNEQEHMSAMFREFPRLLNEQRYEEALIIAQKAKVVAPEDPTLKVMEDVALQIYTVRQKHSKPSDVEYQLAEAVLRVIDQLEKPVLLNVREPLPLEEALKRFCEQAGITVLLDSKALEEADVLHNTQVHIPYVIGMNLKMKTVLGLILEQVNLSYVVKADHLVITTKQRAQGALSVQMYYVGDIQNSGGLLQLIPYVVEPDSWASKGTGGTGFIEVAADLPGLLINQSDSVHRQIEEFLMQVREANNVRTVIR